MPLRLACAVVCCLSTSCVSTSSVQTAETLGRGRFQVALEPGVTAVGQTERPFAFAPLADLSVRYGLFERMDVGARVGQAGLEVQARVMVTPREWALLVAVAPSIAGSLRLDQRLAVTGLLTTAALPLLIGVRLGAHQLVLGPRVQVVTAAPAGSLLPLAGGSLGLALQLSPAVTLMPELSVLVPWATPAPAEPEDGLSRLAGPHVGFRLGFLFGPAPGADR